MTRIISVLILFALVAPQLQLAKVYWSLPNSTGLNG